MSATATSLALPEQLSQQAADAVREPLAEAAAENATRSYTSALYGIALALQALVTTGLKSQTWPLDLGHNAPPEARPRILLAGCSKIDRWHLAAETESRQLILWGSKLISCSSDSGTRAERQRR